MKNTFNHQTNRLIFFRNRWQVIPLLGMLKFSRLVLFLSFLQAVRCGFQFQYGHIRNASIVGTVPWDDQLNVSRCRQCLCYVAEKPDISIFSCNEAIGICHFYRQLPKLDHLLASNDGTDLYLLRNQTFEERFDCCNTSRLIQKIQNTTIESYPVSVSLRFLTRGDNETLVTVSSSSGVLLKYHMSNLSLIYTSTINSLKSVGYYDGKYYLGTTSQVIDIYDWNLTNKLKSIPIGNHINPIRFFGGTRMFVGASTSGALIFEKDVDGIFSKRTSDPNINAGPQTHGIAIINETAFYLGFDRSSNSVLLLVKNQNGSWTEHTAGKTTIDIRVSDLTLDSCQRLWITEAGSTSLHVYERGKQLYPVIQVAANVFNLIILDDYTLITSHESSSFGLHRIPTSLDCQPML